MNFFSNINIFIDSLNVLYMGRIKMTKEDFVKKAKEIHGNKYNYSKVEYVNSKTKVCIICPEHGEFWQQPYIHLKKSGCLECYNKYKRGKRRQHNTEWFINKSREIHGEKYDYSKVEYKNINTKVCIICPIHGEFWQTPALHIWSKNGCDKCSGTYKLTNEEFIKKAREIHGDKYDYSNVEYGKDNKEKICIICPIHGEFWQKPNGHLNGHGCPKCKSSHLETELRIFLEKNEIKYEEQKSFDWLKFRHKQFLDFYLPEYNIAIECQGEQHFQKSGWGKGDNGKKVKERDLNKHKLCEQHGIKIFYYSNLNVDCEYKIYYEKEELLKEIKAASQIEEIELY